MNILVASDKVSDDSDCKSTLCDLDFCSVIPGGLIRRTGADEKFRPFSDGLLRSIDL